MNKGFMNKFKTNMKAMVDMENKKYASLLENMHTYDNEGRIVEVVQPDYDKLPRFSASLGIGKHRSDNESTP